MRDGLPERDNDDTTPAEQGGTTAAAAKKSNGQELEMTADKGKESQEGRGQAEGEKDQEDQEESTSKETGSYMQTIVRTLASGTLGPRSGCHKADGFIWACKLVPPPHVRRVGASL